MKSSSSVRRSSRRTKKRCYSAGDVVQVEYGGVTATGRLIARSSDENAANPLWLAVIMEGNKEIADKELYETSLGEIIKKHGEDEAKTTVAATSTQKNTNKRNESPPTVKESSVLKTNAELPKSPTENWKSKRVKSDTNISSSESSSMTPSSSQDVSQTEKRTLTREERIHRRQTKLLKKTKLPHSILSGNGSNFSIMKKKQFHYKSTDCIAIPMLTGTLYLYHGAKRRAEFVRKV